MHGRTHSFVRCFDLQLAARRCSPVLRDCHERRRTINRYHLVWHGSHLDRSVRTAKRGDGKLSGRCRCVLGRASGNRRHRNFAFELHSRIQTRRPDDILNDINHHVRLDRRINHNLHDRACGLVCCSVQFGSGRHRVGQSVRDEPGRNFRPVLCKR
jgi:hypothetical protein